MVATAKEVWNLLTFFLRKVKFPWPIELEKNSQISPGNGLQPPLTALEMKENNENKRKRSAWFPSQTNSSLYYSGI